MSIVPRWLGYLNFFFLQWFFIRLAAIVEGDEIVGWTFIKVRPMSGWRFPRNGVQAGVIVAAVWTVMALLVAWAIVLSMNAKGVRHVDHRGPSDDGIVDPMNFFSPASPMNPLNPMSPISPFYR